MIGEYREELVKVSFALISEFEINTRLSLIDIAYGVRSTFGNF